MDLLAGGAGALVSGLTDDGGTAVSEIDELLGIDPTDQQDVLAGELVRADFAWVDQLVSLRKQLGLSQAQVAAAMG